MLIHKIFHLRQPIIEARERLREMGTWRGDESDVDIVCSSVDGVGRLEFLSGQGQHLSADVEEVPGDEPNRILFRSVGGMVEMAGIIELFPIRANLTEAVLTLEYEAVSPLQKAIEALGMALDRFLNRRLSLIEGASRFA